MSKDIQRKIAVILVTDVVGFSKMMEKNEDETLRSFRSCREILDNLFEEHGGQIFNTAGDSVLAEFQSAVSAVVCAKEFQKLVKERNSNVSEEAVMHFRIGLNMGDVIVEGENLYGEGVNVAARLEALSQPNGVCLSKSILDFVGGMKDLADRRLRSIGDPLERFPEDPVRMLRAIRFAAKLSLNIDNNILEAIAKHKVLLNEISGQRLYIELLKLYYSGHAEASTKLLYDTGMIHILLPEYSKFYSTWDICITCL